jgi:hypothetical protein
MVKDTVFCAESFNPHQANACKRKSDVLSLKYAHLQWPAETRASEWFNIFYKSGDGDSFVRREYACLRRHGWSIYTMRLRRGRRGKDFGAQTSKGWAFVRPMPWVFG